MRIAIVSQNYAEGTNGQAVFTVALADGLARSGHQVLVIRPGPRSARRVRGAVRVADVRSLQFGRLPSEALTLAAGGTVGRLLDGHRPDIVHLQDHYPLCRSTLGEASRRAIPVVATNHFLPLNMLAYVPIPRAAVPAAEELLWAWVRGVFNAVAASTAPTATAVRLLEANGVTTAREPISCGVDVDLFRPRPAGERAAARRRHGLPITEPLLVYVGRLDPEKRLDVLIDALAKLSRSSDWHVVLVGDGHAAGHLRRRVRQLGLAPRVTFLGRLAGDELRAVLAAGDLFVMPSEAELQSIATLEALASGLPAIVADAKALPELVEHEVNGRIFRAGDAVDLARQLEAVLGSRGSWPAMAAAGRATAESHDRRVTVERYEALYRAVVSGA